MTRLSAEIDRLSAEQELLWRELRAERMPPPVDSATYRSFLDRFRGSPESVKEKAASYVDRLREYAPVIDLGCGRGELLMLLREAGIAARGVDVDEALVREGAARGLDVAHADARQYVQALPPGSAGAIVMLQLVEHLPFRDAVTLLSGARRALRPDGRLIVETVNVASWAAFSNGFLRDYTHATPFHAETLAHLVSCAGFEDVSIEYRGLCEQRFVAQHFSDPALPPALQATLNHNVDVLNHRLFGYQDYAIVATRP
jgi:SAM-dependent methyltransferase